MRKLLAVLLLVLVAASVATAQAEKPTLYQKPAISKTHIAFVHAGDLWIVNRDGGVAERLTTGVGVETDPYFSPDGSLIAFTGEYDGNTDVYVVPATGGIPKRLTYHPGADSVVGWMPDGKQILFRSQRNSYSSFTRLFTISTDGGFPAELPLVMAYSGSYSADGARLAYMPMPPAFAIWKRYRGGRTSPVWIAKLSDSSIEKLPRENSNDFSPMWVGNKVYFLSDRSGTVTLYAYDTGTKKVTQVIENKGLDIKSASAGPGAIVYEQFGSLHLYDLNAGKERALKIALAGDLPGVRPRFEKVASRIINAAISPSGARAVFQARGEILTVPAEKGDVRNLTRSSGVADRDPSWSPDGKWIAYFSDESGEYALHLREQSGQGEVKKISLGNPPSFFYSPVWAPDSKKIAFHDKRLNLWYLELEKGTPVKVDTDLYDHPERSLDPTWAPDGKWLAYTKRLRSQFHAVFVYSLESAKGTQITDGLSDGRYPVWDKNGKHLYFAASTDYATSTGWLDMSSYNRLVSRSVYVVVLKKDLPSPLAPESDEEKVQDAKPEEKKDAAAKPEEKEKPKEKSKEAVSVAIDFENISQRILALPIPARAYSALYASKTGILFLLEGQPLVGFPFTGMTLHKFELEKRKVEKVMDSVMAFDLSFNGEKMLYRLGPDRWFISATAQPPKPGEGQLKTDQMEVRVEPRAEWAQMYHEAWRIERDFLYDPGAHGLDLGAAEKKYAPYLDAVAHRADLSYLFAEMLGNLVLGHTYIQGGDVPQPARVPGGLLGADYKIENGRYRFARVYNGENWNPQLRAPLTQPGVNVVAGEYLLAVNGREVRATDSVYSFFEATAGKAVLLKVGPNPDGKDAREVTVVPVESEFGLRNLAWIEDNRRKVDQLSGGRLAYVYLPNTGGPGYINFNRYYFSQVGREGALIDERFNGGGSVADYMIDYLKRPLLSYWHTREGEDFATPFASIFGPKAMLINEFAGSGGDFLPWSFRKSGIGPLVGKRTWGGLVGIYDYPQLIDGGFVTAPRLAFWNPNGTWDVENNGVAPDIEVELDPKALREGHDPQLEKAVEWLLDSLKKNPLPRHQRPAFPNYYKK
ncbi:MAG: PD40 domain-containing protein [Acidobacteria bacterium]|nr:PD40 domain-containing protein [Acidobacteriota bacterium]